MREVFIATVDGTHCPIQEPRKQPSSTWYSPKINGPAAAYEVAISTQRSEIVWINGPFPGGKPDISIFREPDGLSTIIPPGRMLIGDQGYRGDDRISIRTRFDTLELRNFRQRACARQETINSRLKSFKVLSTDFRHGFENHKKAFEAVCVLVQYEITGPHPLFPL